jgi:hypothetical protein
MKICKRYSWLLSMEVIPDLWHFILLIRIIMAKAWTKKGWKKGWGKGC